MIRFVHSLLLLLITVSAKSEDGYRLWLRYDKITDQEILQTYRAQIRSIHFYGTSPTLSIAKTELINGIEGLLDKEIVENNLVNNGSVLVFKKSDPGITILSNVDYTRLGKEGFIIQSISTSQKNITVITANTDVAILYG